jgi:hypothetical protein
MPKILNRFRQKQSQTIVPTVKLSATDVVLQRLANASQLGVLILAVFGYFYTVLPIYQKSLLDEEIAKKTLQLNAMETEFAAMSKKTVELKEMANAARAGLGKAKAEVGKLRDAVDLQYSELLPRLIGDFESLTSANCKLSKLPEGGFADCVESKVISSPNLSSLKMADRNRLLQIVRKHNLSIQKSWSEYSAAMEQRKRVILSKKKDAQTKCDQLKLGEDYKDKIKRMRIENECSSDMLNASSDDFKIVLEEYQFWSKFISPAMSKISDDFFRSNP